MGVGVGVVNTNILYANDDGISPQNIALTLYIA
jgi:hypothetical protein